MPATDPDSLGVQVRVLGPLEVTVDGQTLALGGTRPRSVLALLAFDVNRVVGVDRMIDAIWGEDSTGGVPATLQVHVSNLRRSLEPAAERLGQPEMIVTRRPGYSLEVPPEAHDLLQAEALIANARSQVAQSPDAAIAGFDAALVLWRGDALADLAHEPFAWNLATRVNSLRNAVMDDRAETALGCGRHREILGDLVSNVAAEPTNERRRALLMLALYRDGRQGEALAVYQDTRRALIDELGIEPSPPLRELEARILAQDPTLLLAQPVRSRPELVELSTLIGSSLLVVPASLAINGETIALTAPVNSIGRRYDHDVVLDDPKASRSHAEIRLVDGEYQLVDAKSTNGTYLNGERTADALLCDGDEIRIGSTLMTFHLGTR